MYNALTFYYSGSQLKDTYKESMSPHFHTQLQKITNWLSAEHLQHQQWASIVTQQYDQTTISACQIFYGPQMTNTSTKSLSINMAPLTIMSSRLLQSQVPFCHTESVFPGVKGFPKCVYSAKVRPSDAQQWMSSLQTKYMKMDLRLFLLRFVAWFQFCHFYLSSYVRKIGLQEEGRLSDSLSNGLICNWLAAYPMPGAFQYLKPPFLGPTQAHILNHLNEVKEEIKRLKAVSQSYLITQLNHRIRQWIALWDISIHWQTLSYCDDRLRRFLQRWAKRRHPNKGWGWVCHKYWRRGSRASQYLFWFRLLTPVGNFSKEDFEIGLHLKSYLKTLLQNRIRACVELEPSPAHPGQFFCIESNKALMTYSTVAFKKWQKSRTFESFLLY